MSMTVSTTDNRSGEDFIRGTFDNVWHDWTIGCVKRFTIFMHDGNGGKRAVPVLVEEYFNEDEPGTPLPGFELYAAVGTNLSDLSKIRFQMHNRQDARA